MVKHTAFDDPRKEDSEALRSDWQAVGNDLRYAMSYEEAYRRSQENKRRFNAMAQGKTPQEKLFIYRKMVNQNRRRKQRSICYCCCFLFSVLWAVLLWIAILIGGV